MILMQVYILFICNLFKKTLQKPIFNYYQKYILKIKKYISYAL